MSSPRFAPANDARFGRVCAGARTAFAARRRQDPVERLNRLGMRLDELTRDVSFGATTHREVERRIGEAEAIAAELIAIFRKPDSERGGRTWR